MKYISLLPSTIITVGFERSCLIDVEKSVYCIVPNSLAELFLENRCLIYHEIYKSLDENDKITFDEYLLFLETNNFVISSTKSLNFIYFDKADYEVPYHIQNGIIDLNSEETLVEKLDFFKEKPETIQFRLFFSPSLSFMITLVECLYQRDFLNVEIIFNHSNKIDIQSYKELYNRYNIISKLVIMDFEENKSIIPLKIIGVKEKLFNKNQCGKISEKMFMPNIKTVSNSINCNSCLYKKISLDINGDIKNCPSLKDSYGNIKNTTLEEVLNKRKFKKYWNINKDEVEVCKDCEFRHICTDCRAYIEDPNNQYSKPLKCGYNPYTNVWEEWSTNPLKQKAIEYYSMQDLVKKDA